MLVPFDGRFDAHRYQQANRDGKDVQQELAHTVDRPMGKVNIQHAYTLLAGVWVPKKYPDGFAGPRGLRWKGRVTGMQERVSLQAKFALFHEQWQPKIVAQLNDYDVMVVRLQGEFVWHSHPDTDDFFLVLEGELDIELRDRTVTLKAGELFVVPKGVEHRPVARKGEVKLLLIEPQGTPNTGDASTAVRKEHL
jgi:mannose-6-phosphate isomerase-like protein (cupin superfamily)